MRSTRGCADERLPYRADERRRRRAAAVGAPPAGGVPYPARHAGGDRRRLLRYRALSAGCFLILLVM